MISVLCTLYIMKLASINIVNHKLNIENIVSSFICRKVIGTAVSGPQAASLCISRALTSPFSFRGARCAVLCNIMSSTRPQSGGRISKQSQNMILSFPTFFGAIEKSNKLNTIQNMTVPITLLRQPSTRWRETAIFHVA